MPSSRWLLAAIWICFLFRGWFSPRDQPGQRDIEESFKFVPVPWEVRGWDVFRSSLTDACPNRAWSSSGSSTGRHNRCDGDRATNK